jgi:DNA-binding CsgD family transcriptional regulator
VSGTAGVLLERDRELAVLAGMIGSACEGAGGAAFIEGESGIGKTALVAAARDRASEAGMAVLSARGGELEAEFAWGVVRQLFDLAVVGAPVEDRSGLFEGAAALARPALGIETTADAVDISYSTLHGLYWLTVNLAHRRPMLLAIDDLQWADLPSLRFVAHLLPRIPELPILLLVATRPPRAGGSAVEPMTRIATDPVLTTLHPAPLSQTASIVLVREELSNDASDDLGVACHDVTGGNPFLLRALLVDLADGAGGEASVEHVRRMTPAAVSASVLLRLARLPKGALAVARAAAILGASADLRTVRLLAGLEADEAAEDAGVLTRAGILDREGTFAFAHPLVRSAVYGDLSMPERSRWHYHAARVLAEHDAPREQIAPHLVESLPNGDPWTVERLREIAAEAADRGALEIAVDCLARALAEPPSGAVRADVLLELGQIEARQDPATAVPHLRQALANTSDRSTQAAITLELGDALTLCGQLSEAVRVLGNGLEKVGHERPDVRASMEAAQLSAARWEPTTQELRHQLVREVAHRAASGDRLDPRLHCQLAIEESARGIDREAAIHHARETLDATVTSPTAGSTAAPEAILVLTFADQAEEARHRIDEWLAIARRQVWPLGVSVASTCGSLAALYRGAVGEAVAHARGAIAGNADIRLGPITIAFLVEALIERDEVELARRELADRSLDGELPLSWATTPLLLARGRLHAAAGDHRSAISDLSSVGERCAAWGISNPAMTPWRSSAAISLARVGERPRAIVLTDEEVALARRWGAPRAIGVALRAAGMARDADDGLQLLHEAVGTLESSAAPLEHARALTDLGSALRRRGHRSGARQQLRKGLDLAHRLGGIAVADRAREELTIAGARPRRDALIGRDALTPSELRVAELAADGRTNREIAEALFLTQRTVEAHLTSSYAKLDIASRRQLTAALQRAAT